MATYIESNANTDELVLVTDEYMNSTYEYYSDQDEVTTEFIDDGVKSATLRKTVSGRDDVWLVVSHTSSANETRLLSTLRNEYQQIEQREYKGIDVHYFRSQSNQGSQRESTTAGNRLLRSSARNTVVDHTTGSGVKSINALPFPEGNCVGWASRNTVSVLSPEYQSGLSVRWNRPIRCPVL